MQSVHSFSFFPGLRFPSFSSCPEMTQMGITWGRPCGEQRFRLQQPPRGHSCLGALTSGSLESVFAEEDAVVPRLAPGSLVGLKQHSMMWYTELAVGSMSCIRIGEPLLPSRISPSGPSGVQQTCLRVIVQLLRVMPEAYRGVEDSTGARGIGMQHVVFALLPEIWSDMVRPNAPETSTKIAIIRSNPRGDGP